MEINAGLGDLTGIIGATGLARKSLVKMVPTKYTDIGLYFFCGKVLD
ncbi:hypothetical protein ACFLTP_09750 [Chloroflexota bacterium]